MMAANGSCAQKACQNCRRLKCRCDRDLHGCSTCAMLRKTCVYDPPKKRGRKTNRERLEVANGRPVKSTFMNSTVRDSLQDMIPCQDVSDVIYTEPPSVDATPEDLQYLTKYFFDAVNGLPFHLPEDPSLYHSYFDGTAPKSVTYTVYALAAWHLALSGLNKQKYINLSWSLAGTARSALEFDKPSIGAMQACLLLSQLSYCQGDGRRTLMFVGISCAMCRVLELNTNEPLVKPEEVERASLCLAVSYILDRCFASGSKRDLTLQDSDIELFLSRLNPLDDSLLREWIEIVGIWGRLHSIVRSGLKNADTPTAVPSGLASISEQAISWKQKLRPRDKYSVEAMRKHIEIGSGSRFLQIHAMYHCVQCVLKRLASNNPECLSSQDKATPVDHARSMTEIIGTAGELMPYTAISPILGFCLFVASQVYISKINEDTGTTREEAKDLLKSSLKILRKLKEQWPILEHVCCTLQDSYTCSYTPGNISRTVSPHPRARTANTDQQSRAAAAYTLSELAGLSNIDQSYVRASTEEDLRDVNQKGIDTGFYNFMDLTDNLGVGASHDHVSDLWGWLDLLNNVSD